MAKSHVTKAPVSLEARECGDGFIRAWFVLHDAEDAEVGRLEVSTLRTKVAEASPETFEAWKAALTVALRVTLASATGIDESLMSTRERNPDDPGRN